MLPCLMILLLLLLIFIISLIFSYVQYFSNNLSMTGDNNTTELSSNADVLEVAQEIIDTLVPYISDEVSKEVCEVTISDTVYVDISKFSSFIGFEVQSCCYSFNQGKCQHILLKSTICQIKNLTIFCIWLF